MNAKKLVLKKTTISKLDEMKMDNIKGGTGPLVTYGTCDVLITRDIKHTCQCSILCPYTQYLCY